MFCLVRVEDTVEHRKQLMIAKKGLWDIYRTQHSKTGKGSEGSEGQHNAVFLEAHVRHCIDLLRNSLVCRRDLTIEAKNEELGGVTGLETAHQCVDWDRLVAWTSEREKISSVFNRVLRIEPSR